MSRVTKATVAVQMKNRPGVLRGSRRTDSTSPGKYDERFGFISHQWIRKRKGEKKKEGSVCQARL